LDDERAIAEKKALELKIQMEKEKAQRMADEAELQRLEVAKLKAEKEEMERKHREMEELLKKEKDEAKRRE
jgi:hypothetical protein